MKNQGKRIAFVMGGGSLALALLLASEASKGESGLFGKIHENDIVEETKKGTKNDSTGVSNDSTIITYDTEDGRTLVGTLGEINAYKRSMEYLTYINCSEITLSSMLESAGYLDSEIEFALENLQVDWDEIALNKALSILEVTPYSYDGLMDNLQSIHRFTYEQAEYAADNCCADWTEQALRKIERFTSSYYYSYSGLLEVLVQDGFDEEMAENAVEMASIDFCEQALLKANYMLDEMGGYSEEKLEKMLNYYEFTSEQVAYAMENITPDWNAQAVEKAFSYLNSSSFDREKMIAQLEYEGFTEEQIIYAVDYVGL